MPDREFERAAGALLAALEEALENCGAELDVEVAGEGVLEVDLRDGSKMVINRHGAAREIWVAARSGGFHFRQNGTAWTDTRSGEELCTVLERLIHEQTGEDARITI